MPTLTTRDGTQIHYKDWGSGQPIAFSHGWPLSADAWEDQMVFLASQGFRAIAHDRRGHGRSSQPWGGNHMDQYADDLAELVETLDLRELILVGHSTGGGEVARYVGRHGTRRVAKVVLVGAVPPLMLRTKDDQLDCIAAFSETDFREDLLKLDVPTLIVHGDDDQIVPIASSAHLSAKLVKGARLTVYPGGAHGLAQTHKERLNADLLAFART